MMGRMFTDVQGRPAHAPPPAPGPAPTTRAPAPPPPPAGARGGPAPGAPPGGMGRAHMACQFDDLRIAERRAEGGHEADDMRRRLADAMHDDLQQVVGPV